MIIHIDMDAFYASVEQLDNPELKGKCVIVGKDVSRGVVSAASYEARKFGVRSAMPVFQAKQLCPQGIFVSPRRGRYKEVSIKIMAVLREFSPLVEQISIDEAFMDITGCERLFGSPLDIARKIKKKIMDTVGLTCSVGVAPNKFLAKIASDYNKPDGIKIILHEEMASFIETLPIQKVPGVGKSTYRILETLSVKTLGDIGRLPEPLLIKRLGKYGGRLIELSRGRDASPVTPVTEHKSISTETTLPFNTTDKFFLKKIILGQSEEVGRELRKNMLKAKTIGIKITYADFKKISRSRTIDRPTQSSQKIFNEAVLLLEKLELEKPIRLIGVGASSLFDESSPMQLDLFRKKETAKNWDAIEKTLDHIHLKFGKKAIKKATLTSVEKENKPDNLPFRDGDHHRK